MITRTVATNLVQELVGNLEVLLDAKELFNVSEEFRSLNQVLSPISKEVLLDNYREGLTSKTKAEILQIWKSIMVAELKRM